jgi:Na+/glutamate symporter
VTPTLPRREMRRPQPRPIVGGLEREMLLPIIEDQPATTSLTVAAGLVAAGMVAAALIGVAVAQALWNRIYRDLTG